MTVAEQEINNGSDVALSRHDDVRELLLQEAKLSLNLTEKGILYNSEEIKRFLDPIELKSGFNRGSGITGFTLPHGYSARGHFSRWTPYSLVVEDDRPVLYDDGARIGEIAFNKGNPVSEQLLSTGEKVRDITNISAQGGLHVMYSNECSLKDLGEDCLYCAFNERAKDGTVNKVLLKSPRQVAEAYDIARKAGVANHFRITGGFVPERRELEYYLDVADAIKETYSSFYGCAVVGAPADLSVLSKYKEAGFENVSTNIEVWDKNIFAAMCPGKEKRNGGWQHWVDALEYSVELFGRGNVHSAIVAGLEPLESTLEGIEYLASKGVVCHFSAFRPEKGTPLEGYRSPGAEWHWELLDKATDIFRRYGFTTLQMYSGNASGPHSAQFFQIKAGEFKGDKLVPWKFPLLD
ncbi:MAG: nitrogen fixation protein NifB [Geobacteraceae bacterium]|nr:nitrogen fixation protein NifB [Geobacteraceae bacterium]